MSEIKTVQDFEDSIHPSNSLGYPTYYVTKDGAVLSWQAVMEMRDTIIGAISNRNTDDSDDQWDVVAYGINWEDKSLRCEHTNEVIEPACGM